ncbi:MAG: energy-coupling factor ABC transporter permease, partial [Thermoplasmata archaeon]
VNMGVIGCFAGWYIYRLFPEKYGSIGIFAASWIAVFLGALACAVELALSHSISGGAYGIPGGIAFPLMLGYHAVIGVGEAIITTGIITYLTHTSPGILKMPKITLMPKGKAVIE